MRPAFTLVWLFAALAAVLLAGCGPDEFSQAERQAIAGLSLDKLPKLPPSPTNAHADDPAAAALGATLFFDRGLSANGEVACATCHVIDRQFQDGLALARGIGTTNRRTMPLAGVAWSPWFFWDGRKDSLWSQALAPMENPVEHGSTRTFYARYVAGRYGERYARIFGPLPDLTGAPAAAGPLGSAGERAAWQAMPQPQRDGVDRLFANLGKAIEAFERSLVHAPTRFDRFAAALEGGKTPAPGAALTEEEKLGLKLFIGKANCVTCHNGPRFTDDHFHNTGVPPVAGLPQDLGRLTAVRQVADDPFNCLGRFSDAADEAACGELRFMVKDGEVLVRAYKTPSLRGVAGRAPYMHSGQFEDLDAVLDHYSRAPAPPSGASELHPLTLSERERKALIAFLGTLSQDD
ncbi:MAG: cytochrome c peroxidase [Mesorhizobium sp.]